MPEQDDFVISMGVDITPALREVEQFERTAIAMVNNINPRIQSMGRHMLKLAEDARRATQAAAFGGRDIVQQYQDGEISVRQFLAGLNKLNREQEKVLKAMGVSTAQVREEYDKFQGQIDGVKESLSRVGGADLTRGLEVGFKEVRTQVLEMIGGMDVMQRRTEAVGAAALGLANNIRAGQVIIREAAVQGGAAPFDVTAATASLEGVAGRVQELMGRLRALREEQQRILTETTAQVQKQLTEDLARLKPGEILDLGPVNKILDGARERLAAITGQIEMAGAEMGNLRHETADWLEKLVQGKTEGEVTIQTPGRLALPGPTGEAVSVAPEVEAVGEAAEVARENLQGAREAGEQLGDSALEAAESVGEIPPAAERVAGTFTEAGGNVQKMRGELKEASETIGDLGGDAGEAGEALQDVTDLDTSSLEAGLDRASTKVRRGLGKGLGELKEQADAGFKGVEDRAEEAGERVSDALIPDSTQVQAGLGEIADGVAELGEEAESSTESLQGTGRGLAALIPLGETAAESAGEVDQALAGAAASAQAVGEESAGMGDGVDQRPYRELEEVIKRLLGLTVGTRQETEKLGEAGVTAGVALNQLSQGVQGQAVAESLRVAKEELEKTGQQGAQTTGILDRLFGVFRRGSNETARATNENEAQVKQLDEAYKTLTQTVINAWKEQARTLGQSTEAAENAERSLRGLEDGARRAGRSAQEGAIPMWRMALAADHLGLRGAGASLRMVEVLRAIPPAIVPVIGGILAVTLAVKGLLDITEAVGRAWANMVQEMIKRSVEVSRNFELTLAQFTNFFGGQVDVAEATLERLVELSAQLGVDLTGDFARRFLPEAGSIEELERMGRIVSTLAFGQGQAPETASTALQKALTGHFRSLQETFKVTIDDINNIKRLQEEMGPLAGLLAGMELHLDRTGQSWDTFGNTLDRVLAGLERRGELMLRFMGEPIVESLKTVLLEVEGLLIGNAQDIEDLAKAIGQAISGVIDTTSAAFEGIDPQVLLQHLEKVAQSFVGVADTVNELIKALTGGEGLAGTLEAVSVSIQVINGVIASFVFTLTELVFFTKMAVQTLLLFGNAITAVAAALALLENPLLALSPEFWQRMVDDIDAATEAIQKLWDTSEAYSDFLRSTAEGPANILSDDPAARREAERRRQAALDRANAALERSSARNEFNRRQAEFLEAQEKWNDAFFKEEMDQRNRLRDLQIQADRQQIDDLIKFAQRRADLERKFGEQIKEILIKHRRKLADIAVDFTDREEDILRKHARRVDDDERERLSEIEDLWKKHLRKLEDIRREFDFQAEEAARANDAVALLKVRRRMQKEIEDENIRHARALEDQEEKEVDRARERRQRLEHELEDAEIMRQRAIRDAALDFERRLEDARRNHEQEREDLRLSEERKREERKRAFKQELEDLDRHWRQRLDRLKLQYKAELDIIQRWLRERAALFQKARLQGQLENLTLGGFGRSAGQGTGGGWIDRVLRRVWGGRATGTTTPSSPSSPPPPPPTIPPPPEGQLVTRHTGGPVTPGQAYRIRSDELFVPTQEGIVFPADRLTRLPVGFGGQTVVNNVQGGRNLNATIDVVDPSVMSPIQQEIIRKMIVATLLEVS